MKFYILLFASFGLALLSGCTRPESDGATSVSLALPPMTLTKNASQSVSAQTVTLNYVAINVSGSGMSEVFCSWDIERNRTSGPCEFSTSSVKLSTTTGTSRLFQVIMAYNDVTGHSMTFKYGDSVSDISSATSTVNISLTDVGGAAQGGGHITARYFSDATTGPTGLVKVMMKPSSSRPAMTIQYTEMYAGWFQAFSLENTPMDYILNGQSLFGGPINKAGLSTLAAASGGAFLVNPGTGSDYDALGFFGNSTATSGKTATTSSCSVNEFTTCISTSTDFTGPFKQVSGQYLTVTAGSPPKIGWALLPGVDSSVIDGVSVYAASTELSADQLNKVVMSDGFNCEEFRALSGVSLISEVAVSASPQETPTTALHVPELTKPLVVCPRKSGSLLTAAIVSPHLDKDGGCSTCKYLRLELYGVQSSGDKYTVPKTACIPMAMKIYQGMGTPAVTTTSTQIQLLTPSWATTHSDSSCSGGAVVSDPTFTFASGTGIASNIWLKVTGSPSVDNVFALGTYTGELPQMSFSPQYNKVDIVVPSLAIETPTKMIPNACYSLSVGSRLGTSPFGVSAALSTDITSSTTQFSFFDSQSDCQGVVSPQTPTYSGYSIPAAMSMGNLLWVRGSFSTDVTLTATATGFTSGTKTITAATGIAQVAKFRFDVMGSLSPGFCSPVVAVALNQSGEETPVEKAVTLRLSTTPLAVGEFYNDGSCFSSLSSMSGPEISFSSGQSRVQFYFRPLKPISSVDFKGEGSGFQSIAGSGSAVTIPSTGSYAYIQPPALPRTILPSSMFPLSMPITTNIPDLKCYQFTSSPNFSDDGTCGSAFNLTTKTFSWTAISASSDLAGSYKYYFGTQALWMQAGVVFAPRNFYDVAADMPPGSSYEDAMMVVNCSTEITADGTKNFDDIQAALDSGGNTFVCLKATSSSVFTFGPGSTNLKITLPPNKHLIASLDSNYARIVTLQGSSGQNVVEVSGGTTSQVASVANLKIINSPSSTLTAGLRAMNTNLSAKVRSYNNLYQISASSVGAGIGIGMDGSTVVSFNDEFVSGTLGVAGVYGVKYGATATGLMKMFSPKFTLSSNTTSVSVGAYTSTSSSTGSEIRILRGTFTGTGVAIKAQSSNSAGASLINCYHCDINMSANSYSGASFGTSGEIPPVAIYDYGSVVIKDSKLISAENSPFFSFLGTNAVTYTKLEVSNSILNQAALAPAFKVQGTSPEILISKNHFVNSATGTPYLIEGTTSDDLKLRVSGSAGADGNVLCGISSGTRWSSTPVQHTIATGSSDEFIFSGTVLSTFTDFGTYKACNGFN
ncbi:MAG: hypothetical protein ACAH59_10220 [Pseudobdellovibrionaceae bacterium]